MSETRHKLARRPLSPSLLNGNVDFSRLSLIIWFRRSPWHRSGAAPIQSRSAVAAHAPKRRQHPNALSHPTCRGRARRRARVGQLEPQRSALWPADTVTAAQGTATGTAIHSLEQNPGTGAAAFLAMQGVSRPVKSARVRSEYAF